jgi:hypothetical protein
MNGELNMRARTLAVGGLATAILVSAIGAAFFYSRLGLDLPAPTFEVASHRPLWDALSCRARLYLQRAEGEVSGISMTELWEMTLPGTGFHCTDGTSLEASVRFSTVASEDDRKEGGASFANAAVCATVLTGRVDRLRPRSPDRNTLTAIAI